MKTTKRYMVNPTGPGARWTDAHDIRENEASWVDCTDMADKEFYEFMFACYPAATDFQQLAAGA